MLKEDHLMCTPQNLHVYWKTTTLCLPCQLTNHQILPILSHGFNFLHPQDHCQPSSSNHLPPHLSPETDRFLLFISSHLSPHCNLSDPSKTLIGYIVSLFSKPSKACLPIFPARRRWHAHGPKKQWWGNVGVGWEVGGRWLLNSSWLSLSIR